VATFDSGALAGFDSSDVSATLAFLLALISFGDLPQQVASAVYNQLQPNVYQLLSGA
jgi:hypothetical protein